jgi:hypothetical protein
MPPTTPRCCFGAMSSAGLLFDAHPPPQRTVDDAQRNQLHSWRYPDYPTAKQVGDQALSTPKPAIRIAVVRGEPNKVAAKVKK